MMEEREARTLVERRRHRMFVTGNTEYHVKDDICVGIRKIGDGTWITKAKALKARLVGGINSISEILYASPSFPTVGQSLLFINDEGEDIVTTKVTHIVRPPMEAVRYYLEF
jgi:hypothetical protein